MPTCRKVSGPCLFLFSFYYYHYYFFFFISGCADKNSNCARWANSGYCTGRYENYMKTNCAKSCKQCGGGGGGNGNSCKILCTLYVILSHKLILGRKRKQIYHNRAVMGFSFPQSATSLPVPFCFVFWANPKAKG